jgi:hypothetical protein
MATTTTTTTLLQLLLLLLLLLLPLLQRFRMSENTVLRSLLAPQREDLRGRPRNLHEAFYYLQF